MAGAGRIARAFGDAELVAKLAEQATPPVIRAYHGSPNSAHFDKFDAAYIGHGEGAHSYGVGHYSADDPAIANWYRRQLSRRRFFQDWVQELSEDAPPDEVMSLVDDAYFDPKQSEFLNRLAENGWLGFDYPSQAVSQAIGSLKGYDATPELVRARDSLGTGYEIGIDVSPDKFLDWDRPLAAQPAIREKLASIASALPDSQAKGVLGMVIDKGYPGESAYHSLADAIHDPSSFVVGGRMFSAQSDASRALREAGVPGVRYLDHNSRIAGEGSRNTVMFPGTEDSIRILRKFGLLGPAAVGAMQQDDSP